MDAEEDIVSPPYALEDVAPPPGSAFSLRVSALSIDPTYSHGLYLGRAPQLRPGLFVGRDAELKRLSQTLVPASSIRKIVAIAAAGGLGKTQLAITYAERYHQKYSSVFWLDAKDESTLKQELAGLAEIVLEQGQTDATTSADQESKIKQIKQWFSFPNNDRWLLILDNYDDPMLPGIKSVTGYDIRSYFPSRNQGSILITTRSKKLGFAECLELKELQDIAQSLEILSLRSGLNLAQDPGATALATRLTGFPLALTTAGAYIGQSSGECSAQEYLNLYDQQWAELQENADELLEYGNRTLFTTWDLSLEQVRQQHPAAAKLMSFLAYLDNSGLNYDLFGSVKVQGRVFKSSWLNDLIESKIVFNKAMATLQNYSLVENTPQGYSVHTCVHDWTLQALNNIIVEDDYWDALLCVASSVKAFDNAYSWQVRRRLLQHANRLWQICLDKPPKANHYDESHGYSLDRIGNLWHDEGNLEKAEPYYSAALDICRRFFGNHDLRVLNIMSTLAGIYGQTARITEAENAYKEVLEKCEQTSVTEKMFVNLVRHDLALLYQSQGKLDQAELLLRKGLAAQKAAFGLESHKALQIAASLAFILGRQGKVSEAEALSQRAADGLRESLGMNHVLTLIAMDFRAQIHVDQRQWEQADLLYKIILEGKNSCYGPNHIQTMGTVRRLARLYRMQEKLFELVELADRWGSKEYAIYRYLDKLGRWYLCKGNQVMAQAAYIKSLHFDRGVLTWPERSWCNICQLDRNDYQRITLAMGRFICLECDDVDLCRRCYEKYQAGEETVAGCVGHKFFERPTQIPSAHTSGLPEDERAF